MEKMYFSQNVNKEDAIILHFYKSLIWLSRRQVDSHIYVCIQSFFPFFFFKGWVEVREENLVSHRDIAGKGRRILTVFSDSFESFLILHQILNKWWFLKVSCNIKPEITPVIFLYSVQFKYTGIFYILNESFTQRYFYKSMHWSFGDY